MHHENQECASPIVFDPLAHVFITPSCHRPVSLNSSLTHACTATTKHCLLMLERVECASPMLERVELRFAYVGTRRVPIRLCWNV